MHQLTTPSQVVDDMTCAKPSNFLSNTVHDLTSSCIHPLRVKGNNTNLQTPPNPFNDESFQNKDLYLDVLSQADTSENMKNWETGWWFQLTNKSLYSISLYTIPIVKVDIRNHHLGNPYSLCITLAGLERGQTLCHSSTHLFAAS